MKESAMKTFRPMRKVVFAGGFVVLVVLTLASHAVAQTCIQPPVGLVGWWPGDGNANDIQGDNDGTLQNGAAFAAGEVGQAFSFNGNSQYVNIPAQVYSLQAGTVDFWVNWDGNLGSDLSDVFIGSSPTSTGSNRAPTFFVRTSGEIMFELGDVVLQTTGVTLVPNTWYHLAMTYTQINGSHAFNVYVNGMLTNVGTATGITDFVDRILIGAYFVESDNRIEQFTQGRIDELEIFNRALSAAEIQAIYSAGSAGKCRDHLIEARTLTLAPVFDENPVGTSHTVTATVMNALGGAVQGIAVVFSVAGANTASGSCRTDATGQCSFPYTGTNAGSDVITAFGDSDGDGVQDPTEPVGAATKLWNAPVPEPGFVTGGGQVPSGSARATFGFNAHSIPTTKGECTVIDHSTPRTQLKCTSVTSAIVVDLPTGGGQATITGSGTINGSPMTYRIVTTDVAEPGAGSDSFTIETTSGPSYTAGGTLLNGNVQIHR
jgi:hypothetical protein